MTELYSCCTKCDKPYAFLMCNNCKNGARYCETCLDTHTTHYELNQILEARNPGVTKHCDSTWTIQDVKAWIERRTNDNMKPL